MSAFNPATSLNPTHTAPADAPAAPPPIPQNSPGFPIPEKIAGQTPQLHTAPGAALSPKQQSALNRLFAGEDERFICQTLKIDRKTLYNWKRRHPAFVAELARRLSGGEAGGVDQGDERAGGADLATPTTDSGPRTTDTCCNRLRSRTGPPPAP
jgi:hypothetical protein